MLNLSPNAKKNLRIVAGLSALLGIPVSLMLPNAFYWSDNGDLRFTFTWFFLPFLFLSAWVFNRSGIRSRLSSWERYLSIPVVAFFATAIMNGPVLLLNATLPSRGDVVLEGTVTEKSPSSSKSNARIVFVDEEGARYRWPVHRSVYDTVEIGGRFRVHAVRGALGILYVHSGDMYWENIPNPLKVPSRD